MYAFIELHSVVPPIIQGSGCLGIEDTARGGSSLRLYRLDVRIRVQDPRHDVGFCGGVDGDGYGDTCSVIRRGCQHIVLHRQCQPAWPLPRLHWSAEHGWDCSVGGPTCIRTCVSMSGARSLAHHHTIPSLQ